ncbi:metal-dependent hydrolase [Sulfurovum sp.]|jgi:cytosine/adenosine deaminase-related metal-dependent hydrolase|uniref:aminofutalosine deaminase family hydrolase n=1 Tax=Sulfurovum sp. TaxID=1969726 RepID=UPI002A37009E|nr:metal-dependent hydrolase [Sulfurovum sp.]MDD3500062.1 metal-dependent hydrolase [Sulfurovum sp.]MDY0401811.1 metal-dependent hydrolase [Sulfurovum sp.]
MNLITADYIYTPDGFLENATVAYSEKIEAVDTLKPLAERYPDADIHYAGKNSVLYPGFINTHVHLEFSANSTTLKYGTFMSWLDSVVENRNELLQKCDNALMLRKTEEMLHSGVTTFGAISSFGAELEACMEAPQRVVFFNELIGSNAAYADTLYNDFLERIKASQHCAEEDRITPAIAIHSPYSVHPVILQRAVQVAKQNNLPLSAHFLESQAEREWLEDGNGGFKAFFEKYFNTSTPLTTIDEFIHAFDTYPAHFTHCVQANEEELAHLASKGHSVAHCPRSNRLLGCGRLPIEKLKALNIPFSVATDGLSSNWSLNIFDELRAALMMHYTEPMEALSHQLIRSVTSDAARILRLNVGRIEAGRESDFAVVTLPDAPSSAEDIALQTILHAQKASEVYIAGEKIL